MGKWKYIGKGAYLPGIPAADIEDEEAEANGWTEHLRRSRIYKHTSGDGRGPATSQGEGAQEKED